MSASSNSDGRRSYTPGEMQFIAGDGGSATGNSPATIKVHDGFIFQGYRLDPKTEEHATGCLRAAGKGSDPATEGFLFVSNTALQDAGLL
jgi:hypothetical protein